MRFLFVAPLPSAFGEALRGAQLAAALVARGHVAYVAAPRAVAPTIPRGLPVLTLDDDLVRLDAAIEAHCARLAIDVVVLVDAAAVDKVCRALRLSRARLVGAASRCVALDCWNLVAPPPAWDYGPVAEPLDGWLLEHARVIRPAPIARLDAPGAYRATAATAAPADSLAVRARLGVGRGPLVVWPMARWQAAESHDHAGLRDVAARLPQLLAPTWAALGADVVIAHVSPVALAPAERFPGYRHITPLDAAGFAALLGAADVLLSFNAAATSLATALELGIPTLLCAPRDAHGRTWAWPLRLDAVLAPTVADNPFYATMSVVDAFGDPLTAALRALATDVDLRATRAAAQASYRAALAALPDGADRVLAAL